MKLFVLCILSSVAIADEKFAVRHDIAEHWEGLYEPHKKECIEKSGVNIEDTQNIFERGHYPDEHKFKCYLNCILNKLGFIDDNGDFSDNTIGAVAKGADLDFVEKTVEELRDEKDVCVKSYLLLIKGIPRIVSRYPKAKQL